MPVTHWKLEVAQSIIDLIQAMARQRGRGDTSPLVLLRQLDGAAGERISHLPVESDLAQAWVALTGEPFRPHQAQALAALRRGEPVAVCAASPAITLTTYLLLYATLVPDRSATALFLAPDGAAAQRIRAALATLNEHLPQSLRLAITLVEPQARPNPYARVVITTPEHLHNRILRHHDRAWSLLWLRLRLLLLPDIHRYAGIAGAHLADLLVRVQRIAAAHTNGQVPNLVATTVALADPQPALTSLLGQPWRVVTGDDVPYDTTTFAVWRGAADRLRESAELALALHRQGYRVHISCQALETALLAPLIGEAEGITIGPAAAPAPALIAAGYPGSRSALLRMLRSGHQAVVLVLGELPHEQMLARHTELLLRDPLTHWPEPPPNAYVTAQHLLCAATELPLTEAEVEAWGASEIVNRLVSHNQLVDLPDPEIAWKPTQEAGDPYAECSLLSSSGGAIYARNEQGHTLDLLDPTGFERWAFVGAALPFGAGGLRVTARDEETGSITVRLESSGRRTYPLRRCQMAIREERDRRALLGARQIAWGRVVVDEEIYGYREASAAGVPSEVALTSTLTARWIAPACWIDLAADVQVAGQFAGWSLASALSICALATMTDIVPCYDQQARRIYFVDAQPGGNGLAAWIYRHAEELLPLAYDIALACRNDPLLEPLSRADRDWLLALLGSRTEEPAAGATEAAAPPPLRSAPEARRQDLPARPRGSAANGRASTGQERPALRSGRERQGRYQPSEPPAPPRAAEPLNTRRTAPEPERRQPAAGDGPPDAAALIARLRQRRQQQEALARPAQPPHREQSAAPEAIEQRFAAGERIFCLPYGDGVIQASRIDGGRELLTVHFPDYGELTIDPSVSLVRKIEDAPETEDDPL